MVRGGPKGRSKGSYGFRPSGGWRPPKPRFSLEDIRDLVEQIWPGTSITDEQANQIRSGCTPVVGEDA